MTAKPIATQAIIASPSGEMSHIALSTSSIVVIAFRFLDVTVLVGNKADRSLVLSEDITSVTACLLSQDSRGLSAAV
ncbi:hypothetical protein [Sorangium sp. So ce363]|uniref:hypothetical protein n=1 Tax=Sorangium sp. So ce363 TaxID=3133304 RepID=UPI003F643A70